MTLYPWLEPLWKQWQLMLSQQSIPHAMLCSANVGTGIEELVNRLAAAVVCKNSDDEACGFCHSCDLSKGGHHPDIHWVMPEKPGKGINVEQVREANRYAMESSQLGGKRIIIIQPAEAMNESASNALLKTLETPPDQCVFILLTQDKHKLLPTIISRCQHWQLPKVSRAVLLDWLNGQNARQVTVDWFILKMYGQSPLDALSFIKQEKQKEWEQLLTILLSGVQSRSFSLFEVQSFFKVDPIEKVTWLLYLFNDLQKAHFGVCEGPFPHLFEQLLGCTSYESAYSHYQHLQKMLHSLQSSSGLNAELLIVDWYLTLVQTPSNN
ncbi:DNA polymerase III subunit delta' [Vibrio rumoiensis]|uniref:DNA polymerase III subunit delta' n=1 Tax=Vibrio rumoiensis TaxID=76258 RepID=UPI000B5C3983|nr:DNA polymerase III subunit delta' [Vibrio rumoiensis]